MFIKDSPGCSGRAVALLVTAPGDGRFPPRERGLVGNLDHWLVPEAPDIGHEPMAPASATPRLTTKAPTVIQVPMVAARWIVAAAAVACCVARSAYGAKKSRTSAATRAGSSRTMSTRARRSARAALASSFEIPVTAARVEAVVGSSSLCITWVASWSPRVCTRSPPPATTAVVAPRASPLTAP